VIRKKLFDAETSLICNNSCLTWSPKNLLFIFGKIKGITSHSFLDIRDSIDCNCTSDISSDKYSIRTSFVFVVVKLA